MMISIIVCSRLANLSEALRMNIGTTIDVDYELVVIDNSKNIYSIFSAYNEGVRRSHGDVLCFMHDDIVFHSEGWGRVVESVLSSGDIGVVGVIGGKFVPQNASWWLANCDAGKILQGMNTSHGYKTYFEGTAAKNPYEEVAVVDGLWLCIRKDMFPMVRFDEERFKGFHCYDVDICVQSGLVGKKVVVTPNILIEHRSRGDVGESYYNDLRVFSKKWIEILPMVRGVEMREEEKSRLNKVVEAYQDVVKKHDALLRSHAYQLGTRVLQPIKKLKKKR